PFLDLLDGGFERQGQPATVSVANRAVAADTTVSQRLGLRPAIGIAQTELVTLRIRQLRPDRPRQCALVAATGRGRIAMNAVVDGHWHTQIPGWEHRQVLRRVVDGHGVVVARRTIVRLVAGARRADARINAVSVAFAEVQLFMAGHVAQVAIGELTHQRGASGNEVWRHQRHGISDEVDRIAARAFVIGRIHGNGVQGAVFAVGQLASERNRIEHPREANADQLYIARISQAIAWTRRTDFGREPRLVVVELAVVDADRGIYSLGVVFGHYAPVGGIATIPGFLAP